MRKDERKSANCSSAALPLPPPRHAQANQPSSRDLTSDQGPTNSSLAFGATSKRDWQPQPAQPYYGTTGDDGCMPLPGYPQQAAVMGGDTGFGLAAPSMARELQPPGAVDEVLDGYLSAYSDGPILEDPRFGLPDSGFTSPSNVAMTCGMPGLQCQAQQQLGLQGLDHQQQLFLRLQQQQRQQQQQHLTFQQQQQLLGQVGPTAVRSDVSLLSSCASNGPASMRLGGSGLGSAPTSGALEDPMRLPMMQTLGGTGVAALSAALPYRQQMQAQLLDPTAACDAMAVDDIMARGNVTINRPHGAGEVFPINVQALDRAGTGLRPQGHQAAQGFGHGTYVGPGAMGSGLGLGLGMAGGMDAGGVPLSGGSLRSTAGYHNPCSGHLSNGDGGYGVRDPTAIAATLSGQAYPISNGNGAAEGINSGYGSNGHVSGGGMSSLDVARRLVASGGPAAQYQSQDIIVRVSLKIADCTPDQLPPDLYQRIRNLVQNADAELVQGYLRPGCVHLALEVAMPCGLAMSCEFPTEEAGAEPVLRLDPADLRAALGLAAAHGSLAVQVQDRVVMWRAGALSGVAPSLQASLAQLQASGDVPVVAHVSSSAYVDPDGCTDVLVYGTGLARPGVSLLARMQGGYLPAVAVPLVVGGQRVEDASVGTAAASASRMASALAVVGCTAPDVVLLRLRGAPGCGLLSVEAQAAGGAVLSNWQPCVALTDLAMALELSARERACIAAQSAGSLASLTAFVADLGRLLDQRSFITTPPDLHQTTTSEAMASEELAAAGSASAFSGSQQAPAFGAYEDELITSFILSQSDADGDAEEGEHSSEARLELVCMCEQLVAHAVDAGLVRVAGFLVGALSQYGQDMGAVLEVPYADGLSLAQRCVRTGSLPMVRALAVWAAQCEPGSQAAVLAQLALSAAAGVGHQAQQPQLVAGAGAPAAGVAWELALSRVSSNSSDSDVGSISFCYAAASSAALTATTSELSASRTADGEMGSAAAVVCSILDQLPNESDEVQLEKHTPEELQQPTGSPAEQPAQDPTGALPNSANMPAVSEAAPYPAIPNVAAAHLHGSVLHVAMPMVAALFALAVGVLVSTVHRPLFPGLALLAAACYAVLALASVARRASTGPGLAAALSSRVLPTFADQSLEAVYKRSCCAQLSKTDALGVLAVLVLRCATAHVAAAGLIGTALFRVQLETSVEVCLTLLPLLVPKSFYMRARCLLLLGPYMVVLNASCLLSQQLALRRGWTHGPVRCCSAMIYVAALGAAGAAMPVCTQVSKPGHLQ